MADHYDIYLIHPVALPGENGFVDGLDDDGRVTKLHFKVGVGEWTMEASPTATAFTNSDTSIVVPAGNVALLEVWED